MSSYFMMCCFLLCCCCLSLLGRFLLWFESVWPWFPECVNNKCISPSGIKEVLIRLLLLKVKRNLLFSTFIWLLRGCLLSWSPVVNFYFFSNITLATNFSNDIFYFPRWVLLFDFFWLSNVCHISRSWIVLQCSLASTLADKKNHDFFLEWLRHFSIFFIAPNIQLLFSFKSNERTLTVKASHPIIIIVFFFFLGQGNYDKQRGLT